MHPITTPITITIIKRIIKIIPVESLQVLVSLPQLCVNDLQHLLKNFIRNF